MPIIKSAKKAAKQNRVKQLRNYKTRRALHDVQKNFYSLLKDGNKSEAEVLLPKVYKTIDTASKKATIPENRASRLKAKASRYLANAK